MVNNKKSNRANGGQKCPPRAQPRRRGAAISAPSGVSPSDACAVSYGIAILNPFDKRAKGCCLPTNNPGLTRKFTTFVRSVAATRDGGLVGISFQPTAANNAEMGTITVSATTASAITAWPRDYTDATAGCRGPMPASSPFSTSDFIAGDLEVRLVACGYRFRNVTNPLHREGVAYSYALPRGTVENQDMSGQVGNLINAKSTPATKQAWTTINVPAQSYASDAFQFAPRHKPLQPPAGGHASVAYSVHSDDQQLLEVEMIAHWEAIGTSVQNSMTPSYNSAVADEVASSTYRVIRSSIGDAAQNVNTWLSQSGAYSMGLKVAMAAAKRSIQTSYVPGSRIEL